MLAFDNPLFKLMRAQLIYVKGEKTTFLSCYPYKSAKRTIRVLRDEWLQMIINFKICNWTFNLLLNFISFQRKLWPCSTSSSSTPTVITNIPLRLLCLLFEYYLLPMMQPVHHLGYTQLAKNKIWVCKNGFQFRTARSGFIHLCINKFNSWKYQTSLHSSLKNHFHLYNSTRL